MTTSGNPATLDHNSRSDAGAQGAPVSDWGNLYGSFINTFKSQANGVIQIANHIGLQVAETQLAPVTQHAQFGSAAWCEQAIGAGAAMGLEIWGASKVGALARVLCKGERPAAALELAQPTSSKLSSMVTFGAVNGGLLTPTNDSEHFWQDRLLHTATGAGSMLIMGGISSGLEAGAARLGDTALGGVLRNGYFNNAVGGFVGGSINEGLSLAAQGQLPNLSLDYWSQLGGAGAEFALAGAGSHALNVAGSSFAPSNRTVKADVPKPQGTMTRTLADFQSRVSDHLQNLAEQTGQMLGLGPQPAYAMAGIPSRSFNSSISRSVRTDNLPLRPMAMTASGGELPGGISEPPPAVAPSSGVKQTESQPQHPAVAAEAASVQTGDVPATAAPVAPQYEYKLADLTKKGVRVDLLLDWQRCPHLVWLKQTHPKPNDFPQYRVTVGELSHYLADKGLERVNDPAVKQRLSVLPEEERPQALKEARHNATNTIAQDKPNKTDREVQLSWHSPEAGVTLNARPDLETTRGSTKVIGDDKSRDFYRERDSHQIKIFAFVYVKDTGYQGPLSMRLRYSKNNSSLEVPYDWAKLPEQERTITTDLVAMRQAFESRDPSMFKPKLEDSCRGCDRRSQCKDFMELPVWARVGNGPLIRKGRNK